MHDPLVVSLKNPPPAPPKTSVLAPAPQPAPRDSSGRSRRKQRVMPFVVGMGVLVLLGLGVYVYFSQSSGSGTPVSSSGAQSNEGRAGDLTDTDTLIERVGQLIVLPTDEEPTIATVSDPARLKDQAFFANAKVGDRVLIYTKAKKAYLYDPAIHKLVEVAPLVTQ